MAPRSQTQKATLYILIPPSPLFAAHWSFFIPHLFAPLFDPSKQSDSAMGRRIHVIGDRLHGFMLETVRCYDVNKDRYVGSRKFAIGMLPNTTITPGDISTLETAPDHAHRERKDADKGGGFVDTHPVDASERVCIEIEPPGPSLHRVNDGNAGDANCHARRAKPEVRDCQSWIKQVVDVLVDKDVLKPLSTKDPRDAVAALPRHL